MRSPDGEDIVMDTRKDIRIEGLPFIWTTNLRDDEVREFHDLYGTRIAERNSPANTSKKIVIPLRIGFFPFSDGFCLWFASGQKQTVLYRSNLDWELLDARHKEVDELRQEQAAEEAIENELVLTEDNHLRDQAESAIKAGDYNHGAAYTAARAELRNKFNHIRGMPPSWSCWQPDLIFARFPTSRQGIEFFQHYNVSPRSFSNFAHWFSVRSNLHGEPLLKQTRLIYEEGMRMFPDCGNLAKAACLFFRRINRCDLAMLICIDAIQRGLSDGTKSGFAGRLARLRKESTDVKTKRGKQMRLFSCGRKEVH